ncbi:MAG: DUF1365 domain-containing protein [Bryobacteraceae bacterium]|jgi:DUF1365 family protein
MIPEAGLYVGTLRHRRFRPRKHEFTYNLFMALLDIDRIPELMAQSRWTSYNRFNWATFDERDHFGNPALALRERVEQDARAHGVSLPDGPIFLLTHLRYLGYCFNPISFYFCYGRDGQLDTVLAEVNSTFGERRNYWLSPRNRQPSANALHYRCPKTMHVSPFMGMDLDYEFVLTAPDERLVAHMNTISRDTAPGGFFDATLALKRQPWTSRNLSRVLLCHPWMTAKVIGAIHLQALRLFLKRVPVFTHPARVRPPVQEATKPS